MSEVDLRFLEGSEAISDQMRAHGHEPDEERVSLAQSCMLHGRLFWESGAQAPLETRPLLLYYGAAAFAKALIIVVNGNRPGELRRRHGLTCQPTDSGRIADFIVRAQRDGLFQQFNDVAARLNRLEYYDHEHSNWVARTFPTATSDRLALFNVRLLDCFARLPNLQKVFQMCAKQEAKSLSMEFSDETYSRPGKYTIRVDAQKPYDGIDSLRQIIRDVRRRGPFLGRWALSVASVERGKTVLRFENTELQVDEFGTLGGAPPLMHRTEVIGQGTQFDAFAALPPLAGGFQKSGTAAYIEPIDGQDVCEFSITLAALLGLSSLVRYHPHTWTACVHRRPLGEQAVDESLLPVIETFLAGVQTGFPQFVADAILER
jgi:hypothetical protein